jgi:hypothetical protein
MERQLSVSQRLFASGIAGGLSKSKAYAAAFPHQRMGKESLNVAAKRLAKLPRVEAEIRRLTLELLPPIEDMKAVYSHAFSTIVKLTLDDNADKRLRFDAARWLRAECERQEQLMAAVRPEPEAERMLSALRSLYVQIEGITSQTAQGPLEIEGDVADTGDSLAEPPGTSLDAAEIHAVDEDSEKSDERSGAEESSAQPVFRREAVPGHYPPRFRSIRAK